MPHCVCFGISYSMQKLYVPVHSNLDIAKSFIFGNLCNAWILSRLKMAFIWIQICNWKNYASSTSLPLCLMLRAKISKQVTAMQEHIFIWNLLCNWNNYGFLVTPPLWSMLIFSAPAIMVTILTIIFHIFLSFQARSW